MASASKSNKAEKPTSQPTDTTSPVEPVQASTSAPSAPPENDSNPELVAALKRADEAEARAAEAEKTAEEATAKVAEAEAAQKAAEAASATTVATAEIAGPTAPQDQLYDKDGNELCWNCVNHGKTSQLDSQGTCEVCGFHKDKLYNGNVEAQKANERALAGQQL